jgi:hypothetical protein
MFSSKRFPLFGSIRRQSISYTLPSQAWLNSQLIQDAFVLASFLESYVETYLLRFLISRPRNAGISALPLMEKDLIELC